MITPLAARAFRGLINILGVLGCIFISYGIIADVSGEPWPFIERYAAPLSSFLTIVGTLITAASVYWYTPRLHPPEEISLKITAPFVIAGCLLALGFSVLVHVVPPVAVNGFALLAIAGSLFRTQPIPFQGDELK